VKQYLLRHSNAQTETFIFKCGVAQRRFIGDLCAIHYCKSEKRRRILLSYVRQKVWAFRSLFSVVSNDYGGLQRQTIISESQDGSIPITIVLECMSNIIAFLD